LAQAPDHAESGKPPLPMAAPTSSAPTDSVAASGSVQQASASAPKVSVDLVQALTTHFGPDGWAKCVAANTTLSMMVARGDDINQGSKDENLSLNKILELMHNKMLADGVSSNLLDKLIAAQGQQLMANSDPTLAALKGVDQCVGEARSAVK
jgi:hypothetical protein